MKYWRIVLNVANHNTIQIRYNVFLERGSDPLSTEGWVDSEYSVTIS